MSTDAPGPEPATSWAGGLVLGLDDEAATELGVSLSLASRIDTRAIRLVRTELHPYMPASAESAFWFGPLVARRGGGTVTIDPDALPWLRDRLLARPAGDPASAGAVRRLLDRLRPASRAGDYLRLEEDLTWIGLSGGDPEAVDRRLAQAFADLRADEGRARDVALWAARVLPRLPAPTRDGSLGMWLLAQAASARLGGAPIVDPSPGAGPGGDVVPPPPGAARLLPFVLPPKAGSVDVGARLVDGSLELTCPPAPGAHVMSAPATDPVLIEILEPPARWASVAWEPLDPGRPLVLLHRAPGVLADGEGAVAAVLTDAGFSTRRGEFRTMRRDHWQAAAEACDAVVFLLPDVRLEDRAEEEIRARMTSRFTTTVYLGRDGARMSALAGDELIRSLVPIMLAVAPRRSVSVSRGGRTTVPAGGPVWLRSVGSGWHLLTETADDGLPPAPEDRQQIGEFRLVRLIASARTGPLYLGRSPGRPLAAVKVFAVRPGTSPIVPAADLGEVTRRWRDIDHPGVARFLAFGPDDAAPYFDGVPYIACEYVRGRRLDDHAHLNGRIAGGALTVFAAELAGMIAAVHEAGLVHGHLVPGAVQMAETGPRLVRMHSAVPPGTVRPAWMSPHPLPEGHGHPADPAQDVFGWASLVTYAALGRRGLAADATSVMEPRLAYLVQAASAAEPAERPSLARILRVLAGEDAVWVPSLPLADPARFAAKSVPAASLAAKRPGSYAAKSGPSEPIPRRRPGALRRLLKGP